MTKRGQIEQKYWDRQSEIAAEHCLRRAKSINGCGYGVWKASRRSHAQITPLEHSGPFRPVVPPSHPAANDPDVIVNRKLPSR